MLKVALKDILARKRRLVTTGLAILLGVTFLTGTQMLSATLKSSISAIFENAYSGYDAVVRSPDVQELGFGQEIHSPVPASTVDQVAAVSGVASAEGVIESTNAQLIGSDGTVASSDFGPPTIIYNWSEHQGLRSGHLVEGSPPSGPDQMVMDFGSAEKAGYEVGDQVSISTQDGTRTFELVATIGLGEDGRTPTGATTLIFLTKTAQELARLPDQFNYVAVRGEPDLDQESLASAISAALPDVQVLTGKQFTDENTDAVGQVVDILATFVNVFGYIALFVASFIIYNTFSILVAQRTRETALLRAVGAHRRQVLAANIVEAVVVGVIASLLGLVAGTGLASLLRSAVSSVFAMSTSQTFPGPGNIASALAIGVGITVLSALLPSIKASRVPPIAALSEAVIDRSALSVRRIVAGLVLLAVGVGAAVIGFAGIGPSPLIVFGAGAAGILVAVSLVLAPTIVGPTFRVFGRITPGRRGIVSRLSRSNAMRNPRRTASTAAALTIGVTLVTLIAIIASSIKASVESAVSDSVRADFIVGSSSFSLGGGVPDATVERIRDLPSVEVASPMRFGPVRLSDDYALDNLTEESGSTGSGDPSGSFGASDAGPPGQDMLIAGIEPALMGRVLSLGDIDGDLVDMHGSQIAVSRSTAERRDWSLGDRIPVYFARTGEAQLEVAAIFENEVGNAAFYMPIDSFAENVLEMFNVNFMVSVKARDGASTNALRSELEATVEDLPSVTVQDIGEYVKSQTAPFDTFLAIVYALLMLAVVIALIGIANTLSLSIMERTRELGLLRAVGMSKGQLRRSVFTESVLIALFGTGIGLALGLIFSAAISTVIAADNPEVFSYTVPIGSLVVIVVGAVLAGVVAAIIPAWRTSKLQVIDAISAL